MASQNNSPSSQGKSTNHHSKSPKRPSKFNWEKGCQQVFNPKTQVHQMPNDFQKRYSESSYHEHSGYRDNASYLIRKQNKRALKRKMKDNPETGPSESKKQEKNPVEILNSSSTSKDSCLVPLINKEPQARDDFWHSSTPIPQYQCSNPTEHSQPQFNEWWVQHAQVSESPIGTDQALIIVQNQTYPISVQSMIQRSGLAQWLHDLNQLLLPRGSLNFINIQSPVGDFEIPQSARHESFFMHISSSAFETALCYLGGIPELLNVTESNPVDLLRAFAYFQCPKFPETYFVRFLPILDTSTWAKFTFVHSFFMPDDTAIQIHLHNFNLWHVIKLGVWLQWSHASDRWSQWPTTGSHFWPKHLDNTCHNKVWTKSSGACKLARPLRHKWGQLVTNEWRIGGWQWRFECALTAPSSWTCGVTGWTREPTTTFNLKFGTFNFLWTSPCTTPWSWCTITSCVPTTTTSHSTCPWIQFPICFIWERQRQGLFSAISRQLANIRTFWPWSWCIIFR